MDKDLIALQFSLSLIKRAFRDLAVAFAAVDAKAADDAIHAIEVMVVTEFDMLRKKPPDGISSSDMGAALAEALGPLREATQSARALIQQAGQKKH